MDHENTVLVTGASGLLGREIYRQFTESGLFAKVIGMAYSRSNNLVKCNLLDFEASNKLIMELNPTLLIHVAAEKRPDVAAKNPEEAKKLNVTVTRNLAKLAFKLKAVFVYISTDYVFDGTSPPYQVFDLPNPLNEYGKSKYQGELEAIKVNPGTIVLRVPVLYGKTLQRNESAVNILIDLVLNPKETAQDDYHIRYPTCVEDVARVLLDLSIKCLDDKSITGIFHFSSEEKLTKYQMCLEIASALQKDCSHIQSNPDAPTDAIAQRPKDCHLSTQRLVSLGIDVSCKSLLGWIKVHANEL